MQFDLDELGVREREFLAQATREFVAHIRIIICIGRILDQRHRGLGVGRAPHELLLILIGVDMRGGEQGARLGQVRQQARLERARFRSGQLEPGELLLAQLEQTREQLETRDEEALLVPLVRHGELQLVVVVVVDRLGLDEDLAQHQVD